MKILARWAIRFFVLLVFLFSWAGAYLIADTLPSVRQQFFVYNITIILTMPLVIVGLIWSDQYV